MSHQAWSREVEARQAPKTRTPLSLAEAVKLRWESDGTSHSAKGGSGHRYEIVLVYHATEWGVKRAPRGWCLKADGEVVHLLASVHQCKKAASLLEERASLF
jgi:hypothetical protein